MRHPAGMTVLIVVAVLVLVLTVACILESRSGKPAWGQRRAPVDTAPTASQAGSSAKRAIATTAAIGLFVGMGDGG